MIYNSQLQSFIVWSVAPVLDASGLSFDGLSVPIKALLVPNDGQLLSFDCPSIPTPLSDAPMRQ